MQNRTLPSQLGVRPAPELANRFLVQSFGWMFAGLLLTTAISTVVATNPTLIAAVARSWLLFVFAQLGLGIGIQVLMPRLSATLGLGLFFVFAATMGVTVGVIVSLYRYESVVNIWLGSSAFGWIIALIGVVVFTVYTAYDVQKISYGDYAASLGSVEKASVLGAIHLYINFVNIFL